MAEVRKTEDAGQDAAGVDNEVNRTAAGIVGPVGLAQRLDALLAGWDELNIDVVVFQLGSGCLENEAGVRSEGMVVESLEFMTAGSDGRKPPPAGLSNQIPNRAEVGREQPLVSPRGVAIGHA